VPRASPAVVSIKAAAVNAKYLMLRKAHG